MGQKDAARHSWEEKKEPCKAKEQNHTMEGKDVEPGCLGLDLPLPLSNCVILGRLLHLCALVHLLKGETAVWCLTNRVRELTLCESLI